MTVLKKYTKQPWEVKDYDITFSEWLGEMEPDDKLSGVTATITAIATQANPTPPAPTLVVDSILVTDTRAKFVVSGGTAGQKYKLTARATTQGIDGIVRKDESELIFSVGDT